ncbi:nucleotidyltransferase domain-containing protein [Candidatus Margulisiibacteriota bacterium]
MAVHRAARRQIRPHHYRAVEALARHFQKESKCQALIVIGSVARERAREDSDIDLVVVWDDLEFERLRNEGTLRYYSEKFTDYEGGYAEAKYVSELVLREMAIKGCEPTRAEYEGAWIIFSRVKYLKRVLDSIPIYQVSEQKLKLLNFFTHFEISRWYVEQAAIREDPFLLRLAAMDLMFFGARMILAHNKILFPGNKWLMTELKGAEKKPDDLLSRIAALLEQTTLENAIAFYDSVGHFRQWEKPAVGIATHFMLESEWAWREGRSSVRDC